MPIYYAQFKAGSDTSSSQNNAFRKLQNALVPVDVAEGRTRTKFLSEESFVTFKRYVELYLRHLQIEIVKQPLLLETAVNIGSGKKLKLVKSDGASRIVLEQAPIMVPPLVEGENARARVSAPYPPPETQSLTDFCREHGRRPLDILVDTYDPETDMDPLVYDQNKIYVILASSIDEEVSDDIMSLAPHDIEFLSTIVGEHRFNRIIRRLGSSYYLALDSQRQQHFVNLIELQWSEQMSILDFNHKFHSLLKLCNSLEMMNGRVDQIMFYLTKLKFKRQDNAVLLTARSQIKTDTCSTLSAAMERVSAIILNHDRSGKIPYDVRAQPIIHYINQSSKGETTRTPTSSHQSRSGGPHCYSCDEAYTDLAKHLLTCAGKDAQCPLCGYKGHLQTVCEKYKAERQALARRKRRPNNRKPKQFPQTHFTTQATDSNPSSTSEDNSVVNRLVTFCTRPPQLQRYDAGVDTCSSCFVFHDLTFFETIDLENTGSISVLNNQTAYSGIGVVHFKFWPTEDSFRFIAFYVPGSSPHILSNAALIRAGVQTVHAAENSRLILPSGNVVPMRTVNNISVVTVRPAAVRFAASTLSTTLTPKLWHLRTMHLADDKLKTMQVIQTTDALPLCDTCLQCKPKRMPLRLDNLLKKEPKGPGDMLALDLMVPPKTQPGAIMLAIDIYSRYTFGEWCSDYSLPTLKTAFKVILMDAKYTPKDVKMDRQSSFNTTEFVRVLIDSDMKYRFVPPNRHGEFNSHVERVIQSLRQMARCALAHSHLPEKYWVHAVYYAIYVKNLTPHRALEDRSPHELYHGTKPNVSSLRVFGSVAYQLLPVEQRKNKFAPIAEPVIFLGFAKRSSFDTAILLNPKTKRIKYYHLQDLYFNEHLTYKKLVMNTRTPPLDAGANITKHSRYLYDTTSEAEDNDSVRLSEEPATAPHLMSPSTVDRSEQLVDHSEQLVDRSAELVGHPDTASEWTSEKENGDEDVVVDTERDIQAATSTQQSTRNTIHEGNPITLQRTRAGRVVKANPRYYGSLFVLSESAADGRYMKGVADHRNTLVVQADCHEVVRSIITTKEDVFHKKREKTPGQKKKLRDKARRARLTRRPGTVRDLSLAQDKAPYLEAIQKELDSMTSREVLKVVPRSSIPSDASIGKLIFLLDIKRSGRYKARLVYDGSSQKFRISMHFGSPTLRLTTLHVALALAAQRNWHFQSLDITTAFLYAELPPGVVIYANIPQGHPDFHKRATHVIVIEKNIYGLKEAPKLWFRHLHRVLTVTLGYKQCVFDECAFTGKDIILLVYVDDILLLGVKEAIKLAIKRLSKHFKITTGKLDESVDFLGCVLRRDEDGNYSLDQCSYIEKVIAQYTDGEVKLQQVPLPSTYRNMHIAPVDETITFPVRQCVGALGYMRATRLDLLYALNQFAKSVSRPTQALVDGLIHCLGYLKRTSQQVRVYYRKKLETSNKLVALVDSSFADDIATGTSTSGFFLYYNSSMIVGNSTKQTKVATSPPHAELQEIFRSAKELLYVKGLLEDFSEQDVISAILTDSQSSVDTIKNPVSSRYKFLSAKIHFLKQQIAENELDIVHLPRKFNFADIMTQQRDIQTYLQQWTQAQKPFLWVHQKEKPLK